LLYSRSKTLNQPLENYLDIAGIVCFIIGEVFRIWANGYTQSRLTRSIFLQAEVLVTSGPYSYTRNPIYLGNFLIGLGVCLISGVSWLPFFYVLFFAFIYHQIIAIEENFLSERFPEHFIEFKKNVPRFLPQLKPYKTKHPQPQFTFELFSSKEYQTILVNILVAVVLEYVVTKR